MKKKTTPGQKIRRIKGRLKNALTSSAYNPRNIMGNPKRYYTKENSKATRGDFNRADLRHAAYQMDKTAKEVARLMERKSRGLKASDAKIQTLILKGNVQAQRYNDIIDEAGGNLSQHVEFYNKKNKSGVVMDFFDGLVDNQRLKPGLSKKQAQGILKPRRPSIQKGIPDLVDESKLPKPKLVPIKKVR